MKTAACIGIFWKVLTLYPSIFGCIYVSQPSSICLLSSDFYPLACKSWCKEPSFRRCYLQFFLSPDFEGLFPQMSWKMNEPGIQRGELLSLPSLSCFLALPFLVAWLVTMHLTCLLSSPGFWVHVLSGDFAVM